LGLTAAVFGVEPCSFVMYSSACRLEPLDMLKGARRRRKEGERHRGSVYHRAQFASVGESKVLMEVKGWYRRNFFYLGD
jgi:hypothetical protein